MLIFSCNGFLDLFFLNVGPCWLHFASFWCQIGSILGRFSCHFGANLAVSEATWPHELALDGQVRRLDNQQVGRERGGGRSVGWISRSTLTNN